MLNAGCNFSRNHFVSSHWRKFTRCMGISKTNTRGIHMTLESPGCLSVCSCVSHTFMRDALALHSEQNLSTDILYAVGQQYNKKSVFCPFAFNEVSPICPFAFDEQSALGPLATTEQSVICRFAFPTFFFDFKSPAGLERLSSHSAVRNHFVRAYRNIVVQWHTEIFLSRAWSLLHLLDRIPPDYLQYSCTSKQPQKATTRENPVPYKMPIPLVRLYSPWQCAILLYVYTALQQCNHTYKSLRNAREMLIHLTCWVLLSLHLFWANTPPHYKASTQTMNQEVASSALSCLLACSSLHVTASSCSRYL